MRKDQSLQNKDLSKFAVLTGAKYYIASWLKVWGDTYPQTTSGQHAAILGRLAAKKCEGDLLVRPPDRARLQRQKRDISFKLKLAVS